MVGDVRIWLGRHDDLGGVLPWENRRYTFCGLGLDIRQNFKAESDLDILVEHGNIEQLELMELMEHMEHPEVFSALESLWKKSQREMGWICKDPNF